MEAIFIYSKVSKGGMSAHSRRFKGHGKVVHAIPGNPGNGFWGTAALCRAKPGSSGYGWAESKMDVSCDRCAKKLQKIECSRVNP